MYAEISAEIGQVEGEKSNSSRFKDHLQGIRKVLIRTNVVDPFLIFRFDLEGEKVSAGKKI